MTFAEEPVADIAVLQEVKTTSDEDMSIVPDLASDYDKLFGTDIKRSMASRLHAVANELQYLAHEPTLALRLREVAKADAPGRAAQVRLRPTVVHDQDLDPSARLGKVYERLVVQGWNGAAIDSWMIALDELDTRLGRLAGGT